MFWSYLHLIKEVRWNDVLDIATASLIIWAGIQGLRTARARAAGVGLLLLAGVFLFARQLELKLTTWLLQGFAALFILIVVIVFQDELKRLFMSIPSLWLRVRRRRPPQHPVVDILAETVTQLAAERSGALIVFPGHDPLEGFVRGGLPLGGLVSRPLLLSLFDASSPGHDGAVIVEGERVARFSVHLPLSTDAEQLKERGTRHAAALGLSEQSDALVVVVSEETGRVSVARGGALKHLAADPGEVAQIINEHLGVQFAPPTRAGLLHEAVRRVCFEGLLALCIASVLWLTLVPGSVVDTVTYRVPVTVQNVPAGYELEEVTPTEIEATLSGARRNLYLLDPKKLGIGIDATLAAFGRRSFSVTPSHLLLPPEVKVAGLEPAQVRVTVRKVEPPER